MAEAKSTKSTKLAKYKQHTAERDDAGGAGWPGAFDTFGQVFQQMKINPQPALFIAGAYLLVGIASALIQSGPYGKTGYFGYENILSLVFLVTVPVYGLALAQRRAVSIGQVMEFNPRTWVMLFAATLIAGVAVFVSFLLLIFPLIWVAAWVGLVQYTLVAEGLGPIEALKESKRLTQNHKGLMWGIFGATIVILLPDILLSVLPVLKYLSDAYTELVTILATGAAAKLYLYLKQMVKD